MSLAFFFPFVIDNLLFYDAPLYGGKPLPPRVYLSDGAHSENLGAFGLLEDRTHKKILIVDGTCDPAESLTDLRNLIKIARVKLNCSFIPLSNSNVDIEKILFEFQTKSVLPFLEFTVEYDTPKEGKLDSSHIIYLKSRTKYYQTKQNEFRNIYGCCCEFCNSKPQCGSRGICGLFPNHLTSIQFFTPLLFDEYDKFGSLVAAEYFERMYTFPGQQ